MIIKTKSKVFIAKMLSKVILGLKGGKNPVVEASRRNILYRLDLREGIDLALYLGIYENSMVKAFRRYIKKGDVVIDVGANIGAHTLVFADLVGEAGQVIAFEPTDYAFSKLMVNIRLNPGLAGRITPNQMMIVGHGVATPAPEIYSSWPLESCGDVHQLHQGRKMTTSNASAKTLDEYISDHDVRKVDLMKIDVDGYECDVLAGAAATIRKHNPSCIIEICPYAYREAGHSLDDFLGICRALDLKLHDLDSGRLLPAVPAELEALIPEGASINAVARNG